MWIVDEFFTGIYEGPPTFFKILWIKDLKLYIQTKLPCLVLRLILSEIKYVYKYNPYAQFMSCQS